MARGTMFHITHSPEDASSMSESDFYQDLDSLGVDFVRDNEPDVSKEEIDSLVERLRKAGFIIETYIPEDEHEEPMDPAPVIITGNADSLEECKMNYFKNAFKVMQEKASAMTLKQFSSDTLDTYELRMMIENTMGDAVYYGDPYEAPYSMDGFIRRLEPNRKYYIDPNTVFMH